MSPLELTRTWFQRVWNERDSEAVHELMHPDAMIEGLNMAQPGPAGFLPIHQAFLNGFDSTHVDLLEIMEQHGSVMGHGVFTGIHHATETPVTMEFSFSGRWENGQLMEARNVIDYLPMLSRLKLFDQDILGRALDPGESR